MGSVTKHPKIPHIDTYTPSPPPTYSVDTSGNETTAPSSEETAAQAREQSLLRRARGRLGTILTGFNGFLNSSSESANPSSRKTLLGE